MLRINLPAFKKKKKFVVSDNYIYRIEILILNLNKKKFINILVHQNPSQKKCAYSCAIWSQGYSDSP